MDNTAPAPASGFAPPRRTLLVGYGKLADLLAPRLLADGGDVVALRRSAGEVADGVTAVRADLSGPLPESLPAADGMVVTLPPGGSVTAYREALTNLAAALPAVPARTVFVSSTGVFEGWPPQPPITESDDPRPSSERSRGLFDGEQAAVELFGAAVIRPAGIYGPGRGYLLRKVREQAPVNHRRRTNRIHEEDLVRALDLLVRMPEPPALVHAIDREPAPLGDVVAFIAERLGLPTPPDDPAEGATGAVHDGSLLLSVLGSLSYPTYREGYADMIAREPAD